MTQSFHNVTFKVLSGTGGAGGGALLRVSVQQEDEPFCDKTRTGLCLHTW